MDDEREMILEKIKDAHSRCEDATTEKRYARRDLANAIREAKEAGIFYRDITAILGIGKTGISSILKRDGE